MAQIDGKVLKIGDYVGFKCDVEQGGCILEISGNKLTLENPNGFDGGYIGGRTITQQNVKDCWID
jgi:hypothetical protein